MTATEKWMDVAEIDGLPRNADCLDDGQYDALRAQARTALALRDQLAECQQKHTACDDCLDNTKAELARVRAMLDEDEALRDAVRENLPECTCDSDGNLGGEVDRVEFAGEALRLALTECRASRAYIDCTGSVGPRRFNELVDSWKAARANTDAAGLMKENGTVARSKIVNVFGMDVIEVEGQHVPMVFAPCADGSAWVCEMGGKPVHISRKRMQSIAREVTVATDGGVW